MKDMPRTLKIATVWLMAGVLVFLAFQALERRQKQARFHAGGGSIEIKRGADGHYHWPGSIEGRPVDFLIDTGATRSAMSQTLARSLKLASQQRVQSATAGGTVTGDLVRADIALQGGLRVERLPIVALAGLGENPLLGMDVLSKLRWQQHNGVLTIELAGSP